MVLQWAILLILIYSIYRTARLFKQHSLGFFGTFCIIIFLITTGFLIVSPESSTIIASLLGVGRGVDAAFLITILFLLMMNFKLYIKTERLDRDITALASETSKQFHTLNKQ